jgi:hypothetical protein
MHGGQPAPRIGALVSSEERRSWFEMPARRRSTEPGWRRVGRSYTNQASDEKHPARG